MAVSLLGPKARFLDGDGQPLNGGKVYTYYAGTSTPKASYTTSAATVANTNPVILDSEGYANIWLRSGAYKIVLTDANGVIQFTTDNYPGDGSGSGDTFILPAVGGTANAITLTYPTPYTQYVQGQIIWFEAISANTTAATVNVDGLGPIALVKYGDNALVANDIRADMIVYAQYDEAGKFQVINTALNGIANGGTGATTAAAARVNLIGIGTTTDNGLPRFDGTTAAMQTSSLSNDDAGTLIVNTGIITGNALHNNAIANGGPTVQDIRSGTYTPTLFNTTNVSASSASVLTWMRVGNMVSVAGRVSVTATVNTTSTQIDISLPVPSNINFISQLGGTTCSSTNVQSGILAGNAASDRANMIFISQSTTATSMYFNFSYEVL